MYGRLIMAFIIGLSLAGCGPIGPSMTERTDERGVSARSNDWTKRLKTHEDVLDYIVAHRERVSLAAYQVDNPAGGIYHRADEPQPLASSVKSLVLYEYARQVAEGRLSENERVALSAIEVFYIANSDGGAHPAAVNELRERGQIDEHGRISLANVARVMIKHSDNAATDYLIDRLGRDNVSGIPSRLGLPGLEAPFPLCGIFVVWLDKSVPVDRRTLADRSFAVAQRLKSDPLYRKQVQDRWGKEVPTFKEASFLKLAKSDNRGTTRAFAGLMSQVYQTSPAIPAAIARPMRAALEWPLENPENQKFFDALGVKGGSLPGLLTSAMFIKAKKQPTARVVSLFFRDLPMPVYLHISQTAVQQAFEFRLALDEGFFEKVRLRLGEGRQD